MLNGVRIVCDSLVEIGDYALISWNVFIMDNYRLPMEREARREQLRRLAADPAREWKWAAVARPVRIESNVWIGFDCCILPGVTIGEGSVVGARSVVMEDIPPYCVAAGNPARVLRPLEHGERR
jgi:acetyltransferase-like isoleucine patch superfamily enzyme